MKEVNEYMKCLLVALFLVAMSGGVAASEKVDATTSSTKVTMKPEVNISESNEEEVEEDISAEEVSMPCESATIEEVAKVSVVEANRSLFNSLERIHRLRSYMVCADLL